jgi:hypothetical protein
MARSTLGKLLLNPFGLAGSAVEAGKGVIGGVASKAQGGTFREGFEQGVQGDLGDAMSSTKGLLGQAKDKLTNQDDFDGINAKLDKLLEASGGGETVNAASVIGGQQPQQPLNPSALAMKVNSFMESSQQSPYSNNTGGKKSNFEEKSAIRMMSVADPEENTKNSLFKKS